jgi:hypothetical protein
MGVLARLMYINLLYYPGAQEESPQAHPTSAYVSIRQHTSALRLHTTAYLAHKMMRTRAVANIVANESRLYTKQLGYSWIVRHIIRTF